MACCLLGAKPLPDLIVPWNGHMASKKLVIFAWGCGHLYILLIILSEGHLNQYEDRVSQRMVWKVISEIMAIYPRDTFS